MYIEKLDDIANEYDNTYQRAIKMKQLNVKGSTHFDFGKESNAKDPKFQVGNPRRISKTKTFLLTPNWKKFL